MFLKDLEQILRETARVTNGIEYMDAQIQLQIMNARPSPATREAVEDDPDLMEF